MQILAAPFAIGIYTVKDKPGMVRLTYRIPTGKPGTAKFVKEVVELIESIIEDSAW